MAEEGSTTIRVSTEARERLNALAAAEGTSVRELIDDIAATTMTRSELRERGNRAFDYVQRNLFPELTDADRDAGRRMLTAVIEGRKKNLQLNIDLTEAA